MEFFYGILGAQFFRENPGAVFVFGANLRGIHGAGAAKFARDILGYPLHVSDRLVGQAYGLSTKALPFDSRGDYDLMDRMIQILRKCVIDNPDRKFFITAVGCGLAGLEPGGVAILFRKHRLVDLLNVVMSNIFEPYLHKGDTENE